MKMLFRKYIFDKDNANNEIRFLRALVVWLGVIILVLSATVWQTIGNVKTVITPPEIKRGFWVSNNAVSSEYLEEMAYWFAGLGLNMTPATADYQHELFLKRADPKEYGRLKNEMGARAQFIKKNNISTQFSVRNFHVNKNTMQVALSGTIFTWVADKKASERPVTYMIRFNYTNGNLYVSDFKETSSQNPLDQSVPGGK